MEKMAAIRAGWEQEALRRQFLETSRGRAEALAFARRTYPIYRRVVLHRQTPARETVMRMQYMGSCLYFRQWLGRDSDGRS